MRRHLLGASEKDFPTLEKKHTVPPLGTVRIGCQDGGCSSHPGNLGGADPGTKWHAGDGRGDNGNSLGPP